LTYIVIDPILFQEPYKQIGTYTIIETRKHLLSKNIVFDNYGTVYIVNDYKFLKTNFFVLLINGKVVYVNIINFLIAETGIRIIKDTFKNQDLKFLNINFVKGFYVNIIIKTRLHNLKI
jgi:hypothetical protein